MWVGMVYDTELVRVEWLFEMGSKSIDERS